MGKRGKRSTHKRRKRVEFSGPIPDAFCDRLRAMFGVSLAEELKTTFVERPTTFRINPYIASEHAVLDMLSAAGFELKKVAWQQGAYIVMNKSKADLCDLPVYTEKMIYLQSLASMVPPVVLDPQPGERVLDLTAAPGSKTSQMVVMMNKSGELVANDKNKIRFFKLKANMEEQGIVAEQAGWKFLLRMEPGAKLAAEYPAYFDKILLDAPCSSEARFAEGNPKTYGYWKERKIYEMAHVQRELILSAWGALRPGGTLVYSTCTFAPEENEMQLSALLAYASDAEVVPIEIDGLERLPVVQEWNGEVLKEDVQHCLRVKPTDEIEGFFVAKVRKLER